MKVCDLAKLMLSESKRVSIQYPLSIIIASIRQLGLC